MRPSASSSSPDPVDLARSEHARATGNSRAAHSSPQEATPRRGAPAATPRRSGNSRCSNHSSPRSRSPHDLRRCLRVVTESEAGSGELRAQETAENRSRRAEPAEGSGSRAASASFPSRGPRRGKIPSRYLTCCGISETTRRPSRSSPKTQAVQLPHRATATRARVPGRLLGRTDEQSFPQQRKGDRVHFPRARGARRRATQPTNDREDVASSRWRWTRHANGSYLHARDLGGSRPAKPSRFVLEALDMARADEGRARPTARSRRSSA